MGMYDILEIQQYPLPDGFVPPPGTEWQTQDTPRQWLMHYRLERDGVLVDIASGERLPFHGALAFYATNVVGSSAKGCITSDDTPPWWAEYQALYDHGQLLKIEGERRFETETPLLSRADFFAGVR